MSARLEFTHEGRVARLTLASPKANILDCATIAELDAACAALAGHRDLVAIVFTADGPNFSFGASVEEHRPEHIDRALAALHGLLRRMAALPAPTMAAVRGLCLGGGWELVLACDLVLAEEDAQFGVPEIKLGVFPPAASVLLPARAGAARAAALVLTGAPIGAGEAAAMGLAARVAPKDTLETALDAWLESTFVPRSPSALRFAAAAVRQDIRRALAEPLREVERMYLDRLMKEPDAVEGIQAFLDKRPPRWKAAANSA